MRKVRQWMKDHKKEIIIGVVAAGGTDEEDSILDKRCSDQSFER